MFKLYIFLTQVGRQFFFSSTFDFMTLPLRFTNTRNVNINLDLNIISELRFHNTLNFVFMLKFKWKW